MFKFIDKPNLPENKVAHCVINEKAVQAINYLNNSGVHTLKVSENDLLENEIAAHADLHFLYCGKELAVIAPNQTLLIE
ncbi:MAG: hypothetical protein IKC01_05090, partial [Clostridia bacterium]|nr:hypothetical protein [Clostridia bacterium]